MMKWYRFYANSIAITYKNYKYIFGVLNAEENLTMLYLRAFNVWTMNKIEVRDITSGL